SRGYKAFEPVVESDVPIANTRTGFQGKWQDAPVLVKLFVLTTPLAAIAVFGAWKLGGEIPAAELRKSVEESIRARSAVSLAEDFRSSLNAWGGGNDWSKTWSVDQAGFVRPGRLALYLPSIPLSDYRFEFTGQIERRSLAYVF